MTHEEYVEQAHTLLQDFVQETLARLATNWSDRGVSLSQIRLLLVLFHIGPATIGQIADQLHIGQSAASLLVERLVQTQLAERTDDPRDRRRAIVRLTEDGEASLGRQRRGQRRLHAILNELDDAQLAGMIATFTAIISLAKAEKLWEGESYD